MTTEDDFQNTLDATPDAHHVRLVFADWLQDRGDKRAEGYRALGVLRRIPFGSRRRDVLTRYGEWYAEFYDAEGFDPQSDLPTDWFRRLRGKPAWSTRGKKGWATRREAEDAAATAFAKLSAARRAELLNPVLA